MSKTRPFTKNSLLKYPDFTILSPQLRVCALQLFDDDRLNTHGNLKRAPNAFFMFRKERSVQLSNQHKHTPDSSTHLAQRDISTRLKDEWGKMSTAQKGVYVARAQAEEARLRKLFPEYGYTPVSASVWAALTKDGQKRFFFESMVQICKAITCPGTKWPGYETVQKWAQRSENAGYVNQVALANAIGSSNTPTAAARHAVRGSTKQSIPQSPSPRPHSTISHPYKAAHLPQTSRINPQAGSWVSELKSKLAFIGPQAPGGPERGLELLIPQPQGAPTPVYVEFEIPLGTPQDMIDIQRLGDSSIPRDAFVLRNYSKLAAPPHTGYTARVLPTLSIPQQSHYARSTPAYSPTSSGSGATAQSPITPGQPEHSVDNSVFGPGRWDQLSCNPTADIRHPFHAPHALAGTAPPAHSVFNVPLVGDNAGSAPWKLPQRELPAPVGHTQPSGSYYGNVSHVQTSQQISSVPALHYQQLAPPSPASELEWNLIIRDYMKRTPEEIEFLRAYLPETPSQASGPSQKLQ